LRRTLCVSQFAISEMLRFAQHDNGLSSYEKINVLQCWSVSILHPSSFILHPSSFILHLFLNPPPRRAHAIHLLQRRVEFAIVRRDVRVRERAQIAGVFR